jgi:protein phosphatase
MAGVLGNLLSRLGARKLVDTPAPMPVSARVPVFVRDYDDEDDEPSAVRVRGAAVRHIHAETEPLSSGSEGTSERAEVTAGGATHRGMRRAANEDTFLIMREQAVYVVADGMGGPAGGGIASELAVEAIAAAFRDGTVGRRPHAHAHVPRFAAELVESIGAANEAIHDLAAKNGRMSEMGTTVVVARFDANDGRLYVGHVGDSRCYRLREGALEQLTRDHTMSEHGVSGREGAYLSRAVGPKPLVEADVAVIEPRPGDVYLLCTDGLTKMVPDAVIRDVLSGEDSPLATAEVLVERANAAGGRDNVTALVLQIATPRAGDDDAVA